MHSLKAVFYNAILVAQMFTALAAPSLASPPDDVEGKSNPKSADPLANGPKGLETQIKGEIGQQMEIQQVRTR